MQLYKQITAIAAVFLIVYVAGTYIFNQSQIVSVEMAKYSEIEFSEKPSHSSQYILPEKEQTALNDEEIEVVPTQNNADVNEYSQNIQKSQDSKYQNIKRIPIKKAEPLAYNSNLDLSIDKKINQTDNLYNNQTDEVVSFTLEYKKSEPENRLVATFNKIFDAGREFDLTESVQNLREKRNDFLLSSLNK